MLKRKLKNKLAEEHGSGLVLALMVLLVLSVLGASLGVVTIGSLQLSTVTRDTNSAYYIAEAGANIAYKDLEESLSKSYESNENYTDFYTSINNDIKEFFSGKKYDGTTFSKQHGEYPTAKVNITKEDTGEARKYKIQSTGEVDDKKRTVEKEVWITWIQPEKPNVFPKIPKSALLVNGKIVFNGGNINGNISIDSNDPKKEEIIKFGGGINLNGKVYVDLENEEEKETIFSFSSDYQKKLLLEKIEHSIEVIDWNSIKKYTESRRSKIKKLEMYYKEISNEKPRENINLDRTENLDLSSYNYYEIKNSKINGKYQITVGNTDTVIFAEELTSGGNTDIKVIGSGSLTIIVGNSAVIDGSFRLEGENIKIVSVGSTNIKIGGDSKIIADIFAPKSDIVIVNSGKVIGNITAEDLDVLGNGQVIGNVFAAEEVEIKNSGKITGNIIAEDVEIEGDGQVIGNIIAEKIEVKNSGTVIGSIIAKEVELKGSPTITYKEFSFNDSDKENEISEDATVESMLTPGPVLETDN